MKRRFSILKYGFRMEFTSILKVKIAYAVLHLAKQLGDADFQEHEEEEEQH